MKSVKMKKIFIVFAMALICLIGCNDKPEIQPTNYEALSVYPNPALYITNISVGSQINGAFTLQVFNTKGKLILDEKGTQGQQRYSINLADEPAGKYQVILKTDNLTATQTILKL